MKRLTLAFLAELASGIWLWKARGRMGEMMTWTFVGVFAGSSLGPLRLMTAILTPEAFNAWVAGLLIDDLRAMALISS